MIERKIAFVLIFLMTWVTIAVSPAHFQQVVALDVCCLGAIILVLTGGKA